jgi:thiosulfate dehydrogenase [quinone] large subunit
MSKYRDRELAFAILRLTLGINILLHGLTRIFGPGAEVFASVTKKQFEGTFLPSGLVFAFLAAVPFVEAVLGLLTTFGLYTRWALIGGSLLIIAFVFGTALRSDWASVGNQMIYGITYYVLLANCRYDRLSLDHWLRRAERPPG